MPDGLYERDFLVWSERQADLLRRLATGERVNADLDWGNLVEEVEDLGRSELHTVVSLLSRALEHLLKLKAWSASRDAEHWRGEAMTFLSDAADRWTPSMRQGIDLGSLYQRSSTLTAATTVDGQPPAPLPLVNPFTFDDLIVAMPDVANVDGLVAKLDAAPASAGSVQTGAP